MVDVLLAYGANVYARDEFGNEALHYAAEKGLFCIIQAIRRFNTIRFKINSGNEEIVKSLIQGKANVNAENWKRERPLQLAIEKGKLHLNLT